MLFPKDLAALPQRDLAVRRALFRCVRCGRWCGRWRTPSAARPHTNADRRTLGPVVCSKSMSATTQYRLDSTGLGRSIALRVASVLGTIVQKPLQTSPLTRRPPAPPRRRVKSFVLPTHHALTRSLTKSISSVTTSALLSPTMLTTWLHSPVDARTLQNIVIVHPRQWQ